MKIATWNVNSIRTRIDHVLSWLETNPVDVLCVQETKVTDAEFPRTLFLERGYNLYISGQKAYNGVALISRKPLDEVTIGFTPIVGAERVGDLDEQKRVISGVLQGVRIVNLYVPNGSAIGSDKYAYKLRWLELLGEYLRSLLLKTANQETDPAILVCGDFNIAMEDRDIHNAKGRETHIMSSDAERQALQQAVLDLGLADVFRKFTDEPGHFSWWDYRSGSFQRNNGWRIDHHYLTPALYERAIACTIDITPRKLEKPSDHAPVIVEL
jgi:exodeoxyribonuclease III